MAETKTHRKEERERKRGIECVPRHNDYMVLGKHKGWRGHRKSIEERGGLDRGTMEKETPKTPSPKLKCYPTISLLQIITIYLLIIYLFRK